MPPLRVTQTTPAAPGAVAILQLTGGDAAGVLLQLTGRGDWPVGRVRHVCFGDLDDGLAVRLSDDVTQLMPHGGPRVVQLLLDRLGALGVSTRGEEGPPAATALYPEADSPIEADALAAIAAAPSPAAIDHLAAQPALWRALLPPPPPLGEGGGEGASLRLPLRPSHPIDTGQRHPHPSPLAAGEGAGLPPPTPDPLDRLLTPATVAVVGRPNVGKSTLSNRVLGRAASIVADLPGTTRDWVAGVALIRGVAVRWLDTPGLRTSSDTIEQRALDLARAAVAAADVLVAVRDAQTDWPDAADLPRAPDVWVVNKCDALLPSPPGGGCRVLAAGEGASGSTVAGKGGAEKKAPSAQPSPKGGGGKSEPIGLSAATGVGVDALLDVILHRLGLHDLDTPRPWAFSATLRAAAASGQLQQLHGYVAPRRTTPAAAQRPSSA